VQRPGDQFRKHDVPAGRFSASEVEKAKAAAAHAVRAVKTVVKKTARAVV
jgi:hypothetical protein